MCPPSSRDGRLPRTLAYPIRLSILSVLRDQPLCVCVIKAVMGISDSKLSYHLGILKEQGLIKGEQRGNWIIYSLTDRGRRALRCTEHMEARKGRRGFLKNNVVSGGRVRGNQGKKKK